MPCRGGKRLFGGTPPGFRDFIGLAGREIGEWTMPTYKAPVDDTLFLLNDVFHLERYGNISGFADSSPDVVEAILSEAAKFAEEVVTPLNRVGDAEGCTRHSDGKVTTPKGFKDAYKQVVE